MQRQADDLLGVEIEFFHTIFVAPLSFFSTLLAKLFSAL